MIRKHHLLVRVAHWINVPVMLFLILSGMSIYWSSPVFKMPAAGGSKDVFEILGALAIRYLPGQSGDPRGWFYNHFALGSGNLAYALNIHWFCAYVFMAIAVIYAVGAIAGGGYRALLPRASDAPGAVNMVKYYLNILPAFLTKKSNPHPEVKTKYNALQKTAYFSVSVIGLLQILTGWAIHKPAQLGWLQYVFGGYDCARIWHFLLMVAVILFVIPHVILVVADGWDCFRSMVTGWSDRVQDLNDD